MSWRWRCKSYLPRRKLPSDPGKVLLRHNPEPFTEKDLKAIQKEMVKIINRKLPVVQEEVKPRGGERRIKKLKPYKLEMEGIEEPITIYHLGRWWDLCAGPHGKPVS